jgi:choline dehydrogenase-like flavoprotein
MGDKFDVVIVGAGAVAMVHAARLAEAGKSVLVLESGPERKPGDLISSQIWARRLKWATPHVNEFGGKDRIHFNMNTGRGYGGAAAHHYGVWPRFDEADFNVKSTHGRGLDWPISYEDVRPYYDRVQDFVGMSGDASQEPWRPPGKDYPLPPIPKFRHAELLEKGFRKKGIPVSPIPIAVLSQPHNGRPACIWDGWCDAGCPIGAIANPLMTYYPRAQKAGAAFQANSHVTRVITDKSRSRATGVEYVDGSGKRQQVDADVVVLGAFTVENTRILLNSADGGLANRSGLLGRYLMVHPAVLIYALYGEETQCHVGATGGHLYSATPDKTANPDGVFGGRHWEIGLVLKPNDLLGVTMSRPDLFGEKLHEFMKTGSKRMAVMAAICEDQPLAENRIVLDEHKDAFGMLQAKVIYQVSPDGAALAEQARAEGLDIVRASGAQQAWSSPLAAQHIMGGTIMGTAADNSVCNGYGISHDISNLVIAGQSTFPTGSHANTTFTIHALAERTADFLTDNWPDMAT